MKKFNKYLITIVPVLFLVFGFIGPSTTLAVTAVAPSLGTASTFSVLGGGLLSADGSGATISGNLGATTKTGTWTHTGGVDFIAGAAAGALSDAVAAWTSMGSTGGTAWNPAVDISPAPGLYTRSGDATFSGTLTLNGSASDVWIFQINDSLTFTGTINLTGGAQPCNVYWRIASSATINSGGVGSKFVGTLIANSSVSTVGGVTVDGRLVANTGTLSTAGVTDISGPTCVAPTTATLTLVKTVTNDNGGARTITDFPLTATGPTIITGISGAGSITGATVTTGVYTLSETTQSGYTSGTWSCTNGITVNGSNQITLGSGNTTTCTIINNDDATHIIVIKQVINDNSGTALAAAFSTTIAGVTTAIPTAVGVESPGVNNTLTSVGAYTVDEGAHVGYNKTLSAGCSDTIALGETKTCTITNDDIAPILHLRKIITGGTASVADFTLTANGTGANDISGTSPVDSGASLLADTFALSETNPGGYTSSSWVCVGGSQTGSSITLGINEEATCTIINTVIPGGGVGGSSPVVPPLIDVVKVPSPLALPSGPGPVTYTYTLRNIGVVPMTNITIVDDTCSPMVFVSGDTNADIKLDMNEIWTYDCFKTLLATHTNTVVATGWANGISAIDIASATVVVGAPVVPPLIHLTKVPNPLALLTGPGMVTYTEKITNPGTVALSNINLTDDKCSPVNYISGDINNNSKLDITETWTYTCRTRLTQTTMNTATASGDANGLTAKDFAIATVVVSVVPGFPKTGFPPQEKYEFIKNIIQMVLSYF